MNLDEKIDDIFLTIHEMKPIVSRMEERLDSFDKRLRANEEKSTEHDVKVARLISDVDGLGRKIRYKWDNTERQSRGSWWLIIIEFLTTAPTIVHFIAAVLLILGGLFAWFFGFSSALPKLKNIQRVEITRNPK